MSTAALAVDHVALANRLRPVLLKLNRELRRELHSLDVSAGQASLLALIALRPGIGVNELAALERMSAPAMSKSVARLEAAGLVGRGPVGGDRRRVGLEVTEEGQRVLRSVRKRRTAWLAARLRGLDEAALAAIDRALGPLERLLEVDA